MAETDVTSSRWRVTDSEGNTTVTIFTANGQPQPKEAFTKALQQWQAGKEPQGYTFLEPGVVSTLRNTFAAVAEPVQRGAQAADTALTRLRNMLTPGDPTRYGTGIPQAIARTVATPEDALTSAASIAGGPFVNRASWPLAMLRQGALTGGAQLAGRQAFGANSGDISKNLVESAMVAAIGAGTQGIAGALKGVFHLGVSEQAQKEAAKGIVDKFKSANRGITYDPVALEAWASTPQGLRDITQVGVGALRGQLETITSSVINDLKQRPMARLSVSSQATIRAQLRHLESAGRDFLHATDINVVNSAQAAMDTARQNIYNAVTTQFTNPNALLRAQSVMANFNQRLDQFRVSAQMLNTLRESGAETGFNAQAFQKLVQQKFMSAGPGSFMADVGRAAFRGADPSLGTDVTVRGGINLANISGLNQIPFLKDLGVSVPLGSKYVGNIPGTYPRTTGAVQAVSIPTIRDYLSGERRK